MTPQVLSKLRSLAGRYDDLSRLLADPAVSGQSATFRAYSKELAELEPVLERFRLYDAASRELAEARDLWDPLESTCRHASLSIL